MTAERPDTACLSVFECGSIQSYIFGSNRLRENAGASRIVFAALEHDLTAAIQAHSRDARVDWRNATSWLDDPSVSEILYVGGGNAFVYFPDIDDARAVATAWSTKLLRDAPGLRPQCAHVGYGASLGATIDSVMRELARVKGAPLISVGEECLPLTRRCSSTGMAASVSHRFDKEEETWISRSSKAKRDAAGAAHARLQETMFPKNTFPDGLPGGIGIPGETDHLVAKDEPHVAVIHIDGNSIGDVFKQAALADSDATAAANLRTLSADIDAHARDCLQKMGGWLLDHRDWVTTSRNVIAARPLVYGGDDLTLITNAQLGLQFAQEYLSLWSKKTLAEGTPLSACAGVAIVPSHFPFERAYELADHLCKHAKKTARTEAGSSWIDFETVQSGASGDLARMRAERWIAAHIRGDWRPWRVSGPGAGDGHDWAVLDDMVSAFKQWPQSATKHLRDAYQLGGENAVKEVISQRTARDEALPDIPSVSHSEGYYGHRSAYLDGLDAVDFFAEQPPPDAAPREAMVAPS